MAVSECDLVINLGSGFDEGVGRKGDGFGGKGKIVEVEMDG